MDSTLETAVQTFQKLASRGKELLPVRKLPIMAIAGLEKVVVGNVPESPVQTHQNPASAEVVVGNIGSILPEDAVAVGRKVHPGTPQLRYADLVALLASDLCPYIVGLPVHPRQSDIHPAGLLVGGHHFHAADNP